MKININDFIIICLGLIYGTDEIFIDQYNSDEITGILSFIISIWLAISCISSLKRKSKL